RSLLNHLMDYWPLDEGSGTTIDDRAGSNNGLIIGTANWPAVTDFPGNATRSVLQFGAQGNYVSLPPTSLPTGSEITVSFWAFGGPSLPKMEAIMEAAGGATNQRIFNIHLPWVDGSVYFDCGSDDSGNYDRVAMPVNAQDYKGKWSYWTFTKNAALGEMKIYLNGQLLHAETGKTKLLPAATLFVLGADRGLTTNYDGKVADLHIWNVALSAEQILLLMPGANPLLKSVSKQNACAQTVKNQADWSTFDNGDEAFLVIPQSDALKPISDSLIVQNVGRDALELAYADASSTALTNPRFAFTRLTTSTIRQLSQKVLIGGIDELLTLDSQMTPEPDFSRFLPSSAVLPPAKSTLDFSGPYGLYFQEIFFHIPFLVANMLSTNQQFAQAQSWYHYIFNPTQRPENSQGQPEDRFWRYLPFRGNTLQKLQDLLQDNQAISAYNNDPFDPDAIAQLRIGAYQKAVVMKYIDNLLNWGDALFTQDTWESITQATLIYLLAYDLLGPRPQSVGSCPVPAPQTFADIKTYYNGGSIPQFLIELEQQVSNNSTTTVNPPFNAIHAYFCVSENDQFIAYWDRVEDRLYKIRHCQNIAGIVRQLALFEPPLNPADLVRAAAGNVPISVVAGLTAELPQYRFDYLLDRAKNITSALIELGSTLLSALEKKDAEQLSVLRATQEATIAQLLQTTRQQQIDEANATLESLNKSLTTAQHRVDYYQNLLNGGLSTHEQDGQNLMIAALPFQSLAVGLNAVSSVLFLLPTIFGLADGGMSPGWALTTAASTFDGLGAILNQGASLATTMGQYERRTQEWQQQLQMAQDDVATLNQQIAAAQITAAIATSELATQQKSIEQANEVEDFLQRKFSNQDLYQWMINRVSALYFQAFKLALDRALAVQKAYQYELNSDDSYIRFDYWDSMRQGLLAGEGLLFGLNQLEKAYLDGNSRRLEIEKTISLLQLDPKAFLDLKNTGKCQFQLSEKLFDYDFPGHYCRQIKTIDLSIPAVVGPYQNIKATLTQLSDRVLVQADQNAVTYLLTGQGTLPDASTLRSGWRRNQKIALSRGVNDNGMFELNFRDERYLPFEGTGAVSTWELRLPKATNRIDFESLSDVVIHLSYTALDAGDGPFTQQVQETLKVYEGAYYLSLKQGFPGAWHSFLSTQTSQTSQQLKVSISNQIIPPHLMNVNLLNVYWKLDVPDGTIPSEATFLSVQIGNGNAMPVTFNSNIATLPVNLSPDQFVGDWTISVDLTKVPQALLKNGVLDPAMFQNIESIFFYQGEIDWNA
ncbi:MAG TPA: LamG-like jellyroll fold domain-containing protein, partial [Ktedonobacteraceae bacterium]|nr:LamG-like jellyroll fold domain-containing protein [Ktedonobacteraceae bacterium]